MDFRVDLETYRGPLDLLLYLVRKHEVDVLDLPIALIADQYLEYLEVLEALEVDAVGEFLEMASLLIEIKSRLALPHGLDDQEPMDDPREQLVEQLLEYKKYRDAASMLEERGRRWQKHYARVADDLPPRRVDLGDQPIHEIELWDLVSAFGRITREDRASQPSHFVYDETPIFAYMEQIHQRLEQRGRVSFSEMFEMGAHKSTLIGVFLAVLELVRHHKVRTEQTEGHGEIWMVPGSQFGVEFDVSEVDEHAARQASDVEQPQQPR